MKLINQTTKEFTDISSEQHRTYDWLDGKKAIIIEPLYLNVSNNGHRILDSEGTSHYIPTGWKHLYWKVKTGNPNFVK